ncbi:MAG: class I SAM-dependent methyltransferase [Candidatus Neomarinimicrobiota bacterium]
MHSSYPDYVARFYDLVYAEVRDAVDVNFYLNKIRRTPGPVLEVGVGTGRIFRRALAKGADMYGFDISKSMLKYLMKKIPPGEHHRLSERSVTDFKFDRRFDLIIAPFRVFSHLLKVEDQISALRNIRSHLSERGIFIFDLYVPNPKIIADGIPEQLDFTGEYAPGRNIQRYVSAHSNIVEQITYGKMKFVWDTKSGQIARVWNFTMRYFFRYELEHLIELSGLKLVTVLGDFKGHRLNKNSTEFILICSR